MNANQNTKFHLFGALNAFAKARVFVVQQYFALGWRATRFIFSRPFYIHETFHQMEEIGVQSLGIVLLTGFFTGMVLALQSAATMETFGATIYIGRLVSAAMIRELGPVLTGLMIAGRVGSGIAAQIGSMEVTEQIDALNTMGTDPIRKLVTPRLIAAFVMLPILTIVFDAVGMLGGSVISTVYLDLPASFYWRTVWEQVAAGGFTLRYIPSDLVQGMLKPAVFGGIIAITACFFGLRTKGGTEGVGRSTTQSVVSASIMILIADYFVTQVLLSILPRPR